MYLYMLYCVCNVLLYVTRQHQLCASVTMVASSAAEERMLCCHSGMLLTYLTLTGMPLGYVQIDSATLYLSSTLKHNEVLLVVVIC
jgi:hypothetical protein